MRLIAKREILWRARTYKAGDELPQEDAIMAEAWVAAGSASWEDPDAEKEPAKRLPKARKATAEPGAEGRSDSGPVMQGKVPKTPGRTKK